jgi:hypothetical protein
VEFGEVLVGRLYGIRETGAMVPRCLDYQVREGLQERQNKIIGMLRFDAELSESLTRKVSEIGD